MEYRLLKQAGAISDGRQVPDPHDGRDADAIVSGWQPDVRPAPRQTRVVPYYGDLRNRTIPRHVIDLVPEVLARTKVCIPLALKGHTLEVAVVDPSEIALADRLRFIVGRDIEFARAPRQDIQAAIERHYGGEDDDTESVDSMLQEFTDTNVSYRLGAIQTLGVEPSSVVSTLGVPAAGRNRGAMAESSQLSSDSGQRGRTSTRQNSAVRTGGPTGEYGMFYYMVPEGRRVLMTRRDGTAVVLIGPTRVATWRRHFDSMVRHVAHPGEFLIVRGLNGSEQHLPGPAEMWFDPRIHSSITKEESLQIAAKEAVVVYTRESAAADAMTTRRVVTGPTMFVPQPGEWLHTFAWHASKGGSHGTQKVPRGLVFQKIWLMPDQMYHDVPDVRTADDAVLTIRLMIFFELVDIQRMLDATHDPIGDFVNAATADVVEFVGRHDFESFKKNTARLNDLATYSTLAARSSQCGYRITNVVYRGYGAADSLQQMHNQAIEARTRLQLERATEQQAQELENFKLEAQLSRASRRRTEQSEEVKHDLELTRQRGEAELSQKEHQQRFLREQREANARVQDEVRRRRETVEREHLASLREMGVDLTEYLTQGRADRVIELRGNGVAPHVHLNREDGQGNEA
jgi:hypothetical protein